MRMCPLGFLGLGSALCGFFDLYSSVTFIENW